ncbi:MAG: aldehyde dehydrogenase family protein [Devosia sp.]
MDLAPHPSPHVERVKALLEELGVPREVPSLVGGAWRSGEGDTLHLIDPASAGRLLSFKDGGSGAANDACEAASRGFSAWQAITPAERGRILWAVGQTVSERADALAELECLSAGKPIRDARVEVAKVAEMFQYYAGWADKLMGETIPVPTTHFTYTRREALGVVVQITPWNAPIFTAGWQIAPALAAGNAVVLKPSELTPLTSLALGRLALDAGVPDGAVNVLSGTGQTAGATAVAHKATRLVVFVGSRETGAAIAKAAADNVVPTVLELGGKSANIVFSDADVRRALLGAQAAIFSAAGQSCVAGARLLVHRAIHQTVVDQLATAASRIPVGDPSDPSTMIGPINNAGQWRKIGDMVDVSVSDGAKVASGGGKPAALEDAAGYYYAPTVLDAVRPDMPIVSEEVFGPVLAVMPFDDEEEAIALANANPYGLAGAVWTGDVARAHRVAAAVRAGTFWINSYKTIGVMAPFGGFGQSGYGRSSGLDALHTYTAPKAVWVETAENPAMPFGYAPD